MARTAHLVALLVLSMTLTGCIGADDAEPAPIEDALESSATSPTNETAPAAADTATDRSNTTEEDAPATPENRTAPEEPRPVTTVPAPRPPPVQVLYFNGTLAADVGATHLAARAQDEAWHHALDVPKNTGRLVIALTWNATGVDLDAAASSPRGCPLGDAATEVPCRAQNWTDHESDPERGWFRNSAGTPDAPDAPSRLEIDRATLLAHQVCDTDACTWQLVPYGKPAVDVDYGFRVELHRG